MPALQRGNSNNAAICVSILLTLLLTINFIPNLQAQPAETCAGNAQFYESWTQQITDMESYIRRFPSIAVSPDGSMLAVVAGTSTSVYDSQTLNLLSELERINPEEPPFQDYSVSWSPDSMRIVVSHNFPADPDVPDPRNGIQIWNIQDQELEYMLPYVPKIAAWSPDGTIIAVAHQYGMISTLDPNEHTFTSVADVGFGFDALIWSPDSQQIAISSRTVPLMLLVMGQSEMETMDIPERDGGYLSWSPDGTNLALGSWVSSDILIWNEDTQEITRTLDADSWNAYDLQWSPDGRLLARASISGLYLWNMTSDSTTPRRMFEIFDNQIPPFGKIAWLPDSQHLISVDFEGSIYRWDIETGCVEAAVLNEWSPS